MGAKRTSRAAQYTLNSHGRFVIGDYNESKTFSNFFPGIAGIWGIPMWVFYVNRGQCVASFGVESKDKSIMEFQPANKAYRLTSLQGFRTFLKVKRGSKTVYWEPFQLHLHGTNFKKKQTLSMSAYDLTLTETNRDLGIEIEVNYFTMPNEPYSALVRRIKIKNLKGSKADIDVIDGLPAIVPYGLTDGLNKSIARTVEAWVKVRNLNKKAPYYQLNVEVSDSPQVKHIKEGNFFFAFDPDSRIGDLLTPIAEAEHVFGDSFDFISPTRFINKLFNVPKQQQTSNRTPCAMSHGRFSVQSRSEKVIVALYGYAHDVAQVNAMVRKVTKKGFIDRKAQENRVIIESVMRNTLIRSSSEAFDLYAGHTFLDNVLRGGFPVTVKTGEGAMAFNVYSRKHGDLERDYNHFVVEPTYFSQGNGNYRDVNQNRRNDVWFNKDVKHSQLVSFLSLSQADGYNPLVVKGTTFSIENYDKLERICSNCVDKKNRSQVRTFLQGRFTPGGLLKFLMVNRIKVSVSEKIFLIKVLEGAVKKDIADHGEGFWTDHWTYNTDLLESYFSLYPEDLDRLLFDEKIFQFYHKNI